MLVEPPGALVPARPGLSKIRVDGVRVAAAAAALVVAVLSRGDALVLAVLLVAASWRPVAALAVVPALVAASWRWGSTALEALAGAQAVLGPAGLVGSTRSAASSWLAATALLLAAPIPSAPRRRDGNRTTPPAGPATAASVARRRRHESAETTGPGTRVAAAPIREWTSVRLRRARPLYSGPDGLLLAAASGSAAAAVVVGPAPGGELWARVVASTLGTVVALAIGSRVRADRVGATRVLGGLAAGCGVLALVVVSGEAPAWRGIVDVAALRTGAVVALAVAAAVSVGGAVLRALGARAR